MEKYIKKIKNRMIVELTGAILLFPLGVYTAIKYWYVDGIISGTPVKDFFGGMFNGIRCAVVLGFVAFLVAMFFKNRNALKKNDVLKKYYVEENDERTFAISEHSSRITFNISMYLLMAGCVLSGIFSSTVSITLFFTWIAIALIRIFTLRYFTKKM